MKHLTPPHRFRRFGSSLLAVALVAPAALTASADDLPHNGFGPASIRAMLEAQAQQAVPVGETEIILLSFTDANGTFETASPAPSPAGSSTSIVDSWWSVQTNLSSESTGNNQALARLSGIEQAVEATLDNMAPMPAGVSATTQSQTAEDSASAITSQAAASSVNTNSSSSQASSSANTSTGASSQSSTAFESIATTQNLGFVDSFVILEPSINPGDSVTLIDDDSDSTDGVVDSADYTIWADNFGSTTHDDVEYIIWDPSGPEDCVPDTYNCVNIDGVIHCPKTAFGSSCTGTP